jgi:hypothetical protein
VLPGWLLPPEQEKEKPSESKDSRAVSWLSNLDVQEEENEPVAVAPAASTATLPMPMYKRSPAQLQAASLLQNLVSVPLPDHVSEPAPEELTLWQRIGLDRVLYVLLALALLVGAVLSALMGGFGLQTMSPNEGNVETVAEVVGDLDEEDVVLLAYEWDAQRIGELAPLEEAITSHLIEQKALIISVSTDPQGTILSFDLRNALEQADYEGGGTNYVLLGYKPGGEIALRSIASGNEGLRNALRSDFKGEDMTGGLLAIDPDSREPRFETVGNISMVVVMADQAQDVQSWMEQVYRVYPEVPMVMLVPNEVAPVVQPYLRSPNVLYLVGKRDAMTYNEVRGGDRMTELAARSDGQLAFAVIVFMLLFVIGAVVSLAGGQRE